MRDSEVKSIKLSKICLQVLAVPRKEASTVQLADQTIWSPVADISETMASWHQNEDSTPVVPSTTLSCDELTNCDIRRDEPLDSKAKR